ncbi:MAG: hypothetical protein IPM54_35100 [Polyangiaceae bacterium]|nr:hypothetical protein [Polyangiaceae bacterium]
MGTRFGTGGFDPSSGPASSGPNPPSKRSPLEELLLVCIAPPEPDPVPPLPPAPTLIEGAGEHPKKNAAATRAGLLPSCMQSQNVNGKTKYR